MKCLCVDDGYFEIKTIILNVSPIETIGQLCHFCDCQPIHMNPAHFLKEKWVYNTFLIAERESFLHVYHSQSSLHCIESI